MKYPSTQVLVFCGLLTASALFMVFLGTMAAAYYAPAVGLAIAAVLLWTGRWPQYLKALLVANLAAAAVLILMIFYRRMVQPNEIVTLDIASAALIVNLLLGGPVLALLCVPLLTLIERGTVVPAWLASGAENQ